MTPQRLVWCARVFSPPARSSWPGLLPLMMIKNLLSCSLTGLLAVVCSLGSTRCLPWSPPTLFFVPCVQRFTALQHFTALSTSQCSSSSWFLFVFMAQSLSPFLLFRERFPPQSSRSQPCLPSFHRPYAPGMLGPVHLLRFKIPCSTFPSLLSMQGRQSLSHRPDTHDPWSLPKSSLHNHYPD